MACCWFKSCDAFRSIVSSKRWAVLVIWSGLAIFGGCRPEAQTPLVPAQQGRAILYFRFRGPSQAGDHLH